MKTKLTVLILFLFPIIGFSQCWSDMIGSKLFIRDDGSLWSYNMPYSQIPQIYQINSDTGWKKAINSTYVLKTEGTLWGGTNYSTQISSGWKDFYYFQDGNISIYNYFGIKLDGSLWGMFSNNIQLQTQIGVDSDWEQLKINNGYVISRKTDGTLWSWGNNFYGQCGVGSNIFITTPSQIGVSTWSDFSVSDFSTIAIKTDGTLWSWGYNTYGQGGTGGVVSSDVPVQIGSDANWKTIKAYKTVTYAIKTDGTLWSWGTNNSNSLGYSTIDPYQIVSSPTQVGTDTDWDNFDSNIAQKTDGSFWVWGSNGVRTISLIAYPDSSFPTPRQIVPPGYQKIFSFPIDGGYGPSNYYISALNNDNTINVKGFWSYPTGSPGFPYVYVVNQYPVSIYCDPLNNVELTNEEIAVFPNPTKDIITINTKSVITKVELYDINGRFLQTLNNSNNQITINQFAKGIYFIKITTEEGVINKKIIKD